MNSYRENGTVNNPKRKRMLFMRTDRTFASPSLFGRELQKIIGHIRTDGVPMSDLSRTDPQQGVGDFVLKKDSAEEGYGLLQMG